MIITYYRDIEISAKGDSGIEPLYHKARELTVCDGRRGECLEVDENPEEIRAHGYAENILFIIRKVKNKWRIWRKK